MTGHLGLRLSDTVSDIENDITGLLSGVETEGLDVSLLVLIGLDVFQGSGEDDTVPCDLVIPDICFNAHLLVIF